MGLLRMSRTYARLCYSAGGELEQIQLLLRHRSVEARGGTLQCTPVPTPPSGRRVLSLVFVLKFNDENIAQTSAKLIKRLSLSLVILLASAKNSGGTGARVPSADYSRGTAIFFEWLDDRFVAATDSLETHSNRPPTFDDCKIVKQGTANSFFTISGGVRSGPNWDTQGTAAKAYESVRGSKDPGKVADEWRRLILLQLQSLPDRDRTALEWFVRYNMMLFVGLLPDGSIDARVAAFSFDGKHFDISLVRPPTSKLRSIGEGEKAVDTFLSHKTPEARQEYAAWEASLKSTFGVRTPADVQTELVMKVVDWAIKHPEGDQVGGIVEAVELQSKSTITWLRPCQKAESRSLGHRMAQEGPR